MNNGDLLVITGAILFWAGTLLVIVFFSVSQIDIFQQQSCEDILISIQNDGVKSNSDVRVWIAKECWK